MNFWKNAVLALLLVSCLLACSSQDEAKDYDRKIAEFSRAIELNPKDAEAYNNRGLAYGQKGDWDKALADFNQALALNPKDAKLYLNRGVAYGLKGDWDQALVDIRRALEIDPQYAKAYSFVGRALPAIQG